MAKKQTKKEEQERVTLKITRPIPAVMIDPSDYYGPRVEVGQQRTVDKDVAKSLVDGGFAEEA